MPAPRRATEKPTQRFDPELDRIVTLKEAARLSGISEDGWHRHHKNKILRLSPRRLGVRMRDALLLSGSD